MKRDRLVIATRGSALALWQAEHVRARLGAVSGLPVELLTLKTQGDIILDVPLSEVGGKALFVKEIEQALLDRKADVAVHSMKDVPAELAPGLMLAAISTRETPWDALLSHKGTLAELPPGAKVGTSSLRRQCQLLARRPDLQIAMLRGNVPTRIRKLDEGEFDAVVLAAAGLIRLGYGERITELLPPDISLPAVAQGVLGIETRSDDDEVAGWCRAAMHDEREAHRIAAERAFLARMGGSCQTPLAAHATIDGDVLAVDALCGTPDGTTILRTRAEGRLTDAPDDAAALGVRVADELLGRGAAAIVAACSTPKR